MVWGAISAIGKTKLAVIKGIISGPTYFDTLDN